MTTPITITNNDNGGVELGNGKFRRELLTFAAADTFVEGTILARKTALSVSAGTVQGGTGTGTISAVAFVNGPDVPMAGVWQLICTAAATNGGVFKLVDPNGATVATNLQMSGTDNAATVFEVAGLTFTLTDATAFIVGNYFDITVVGSVKLVPYNPAGVGGAQFPMAVLTYEATRSSGGDLAVDVLVAGEVNKNRLIIDVDGTGANITNVILDQLCSAGIVATACPQTSVLDNQ